MLRTTRRALLLAAVGASSAAAQAPDDGFMMPKKALTAGVVYGHERWTEYWEGTRKRSNENIGTLTAKSATVAAFYGLTSRLTLIGTAPYVWTEASQGTLHGMRGIQDLTLGAKYQLLRTAFTGAGTLSAMVVAAAAVPLSDYSPDFLPLSIGSAARRFTGRFNVHFQSTGSLFVTGSAGHTWRNTVKLDRPSYFTDGQLFLTNEVEMPRVFDYTIGAGYRTGRLHVPISFSEQRTLGGGDIRRQDMPFVSDRMNLTKVDVAAMYAPPVPKTPMVRVGLSRVLSGRNVGQSTAITAGFLYTFAF